MSTTWQNTKLGEVLTLDLDSVRIDPSMSYEMVGVYSFGRGLFNREPVNGSNTSYKFFYRLKPEHVVMSQLFGWEGAIALSSAQFAGRFVSPQFPTFLCNPSRVERAFLGWYMRRPAFWEDLGSRTKGMGDRRRTLNPAALFDCEIPLPPLTDQRRLVAKIELVSAKIDEARALRQQANAEADPFILSIHTTLAGSRTRSIGELLKLDEDSVPISPVASYPQVGVRSFGEGLFRKTAVDGTKTTYKVFNRLYEGAVLLSQVKGWEGAVAVCPAELAGWFVSPEYRTFRCIPTEARPGYLATLVRTKWFWSKLANATRGVGARRERTRPEQFLEIKLPMPSVEAQEGGEAIFAKVDSLKGAQAAMAIEFDALMPSILYKTFSGHP